MRLIRLCVAVVSLVLSSTASARYAGQQLAIVVNANDPQSKRIADYYQLKRGIPDEHVITVDLPVDKKAIGQNKFDQVFQQLKERTPSNIQFYALAWSQPYKVGCMSITSAFAFGFDEAYCAKGCKPTRKSAYFNAATRRPYHDLGIRPTMMLAGSSFEQIRDMIDRGVAADASYPKGTAYLVSTSDRARNVRAHVYPAVLNQLAGRISIKIEHTDALAGRDDVLFYLTGLKQVEAINSNHYLDGAIADHLTSAGGVLFDGRQMSILRWLEAGATASYGTVVEPCAFPQKFPHPAVVIDRYTRGETLIEAYWKSVAWPGQGLFVGEPLASPYAGII
ncbi:MAG: TIGR03790 family protein [Gammaproteobacteria bacterium]|jgi:uncharacterized protein (TIGR03790 family)